MPDVPSTIALTVSDIHLSSKPPRCRGEDQDQWFATMKAACDELKLAAHNYGDIPIVCGGDVFDRWNPSPELINFAIDNLPTMYAVPGQHDLPYHTLDFERCGYGVLMRAGVIKNIPHEFPTALDKITLHGFPWGHEPEPPRKVWNDKDWRLQVAVCHHYIYTDGAQYPGADSGDEWTSMSKKVRGYDVAVFGDNHHPFVKSSKTRTSIVNNGGFIHRKSDETWEPGYGVICSDGTVSRNSFQYWIGETLTPIDGPSAVDEAWDSGELMDKLRESDQSAFDFREELLRAGRDNKLSRRAMACLSKALEPDD